MSGKTIPVLIRRLAPALLVFTIDCSSFAIQSANDYLRDTKLSAEHYGDQMDSVCAGFPTPNYDAQLELLCMDAAAKWIAFDKSWHALQSAVSAYRVDDSTENRDRVIALTRELTDAELAFVLAVQRIVSGL